MECQIEGCEKPVLARGWCRMHYYRAYRTGDPTTARPKLADHLPCSVDGCDRPNEANGLCQMHRWRVRTTGDPGQAGPKKARARKEPTHCVVDGCERVASSRFKGEGPFCRLHYERQRRGDPIGPVDPHYAPKGAGHVRVDGYRRIITPDGRRLLEHVYVMEQRLGRRLETNENVHHINGDKADNRLENLELWSRSQPSGQRVADKVAWAREILALYGADPVT